MVNEGVRLPAAIPALPGNHGPAATVIVVDGLPGDRL